MEQVDPVTGLPQVDSRGRPKVLYEKNFIRNTRTLAGAHSPSGVARDITVSYPDNPESIKLFQIQHQNYQVI